KKLIVNSFKFKNKFRLKMKKQFLLSSLLIGSLNVFGQLNPAISSWLQNTTLMGRHYVNGNSTPIQDNVLANVQSVKYSATSVYITTNGIPAYPTGPFLDGNPSLATSQNAIFKFPLTPVQNTGTATPTSGGNIGVFINGVALFDYRDGVAWNSTSNALCGGPGNPPCPGGPNANLPWNRDAILAERSGFDCSKGHPAMGNYHHHQNPSAFNLDLNVVSSICNLYAADGLYTIDSTQHSPLIGYTYDGFPIYGAYGYKNLDGTGGIVRIKSSYSLRNITTRTTSPTGATVAAGPAVSATYPLGYFREDYQYTPTTAQTPDFLDQHNGRFCVTPEYPNGIYCYFATVDSKWNSAYPYVVGPTFYGVKSGVKVTSITEPVTTYVPTTAINSSEKSDFHVLIFPNPSSDLVAIQVSGLIRKDVDLELLDVMGRLVSKTTIPPGGTIGYFETSTLYKGQYLVRITDGSQVITKKIQITE
ncbi:MAG TPA: YHYH protein, partial [Catalimonadaceae bacterium]|nr:YHYH protein [Catalimonadaceae bacterium]